MNNKTNNINKNSFNINKDYSNQNNLNSNINNLYNSKQIDSIINQHKKNICGKKSSVVGLTISYLNIIYCIIVAGIFAIILFNQIFSAKAGSASGWFLFVAPILIAIFILACIPDILCLLFSIIYKEKRKNKFLALTIIFAAIGIILFNSKLMDELIFGFMHNNTIMYIYSAFKIMIIIYNAILLIMNKRIAFEDSN